MSRPVGDVAARGVVEIGEVTSTAISGYTFTTIVPLAAQTPVAEWQAQGVRLFAVRQDGRHYLQPLGAPPSALTGDLWLENVAGTTHLRYQGLQGLVTVDTGTVNVTSVGLTGPSQFSISGSPVTSSGTLGFSWVNQSANLVLAGPTTGSAAPTFRALVAGDIPSLPYLPASGGTTGYLTVWSSASALGSSQYLPAGNFPALTGDVTSSAGSLGTVIAAGAVTLAKMANLAANSIIGNNTGSPATPLALTAGQVKTLLAISSSDVSGLGFYATGTNAANLTGTVPAATLPLFTSVANGAVPLSGGGTTNFLRADGTWAAPVGSVTSVGLALPGIFSVSGSPVTSSGTLTGSLATQTANTVWAGPTSGGALAPTFRALVGADFPSLTVPVGSINASGTASSTTFLRGDGQWAAPAGGVTGSGSTGQVTYWASSSALGGSNGFTYSSNVMTLTVSSPGNPLVVLAVPTASNSYGHLRCTNDSGLNYELGRYGTTASAYGILTGGTSYLYSSGGDLALMADGSNGRILLATGGSTGRALWDANGYYTLTPKAATTGTPTLWTLTGPAHQTLTSGEAIDLNVNLARTVQWSSGAIATQRAVVVQAPTYAFTASSNITKAATVAITNAPIAGTNATITNPYALWVQSGVSQFDGGAVATSSAGVLVKQAATTDAIRVLPSNIGSGSNVLTLATPATAMGSNFTQAFQAATGTIPLLEVAQTFSAPQTFSADLSIAKAVPSLLMQDTAAAVDTQRWYWQAHGASFYGYIANDANSVSSQWLRIDRVTSLVDAIVLLPSSLGNVGISVTPTAGNGLLQFASGTTKANGVAFGTDTFLYRSGFATLLSTGWFTCGDGTQLQSQIVNGTNSGTGGGARLRIQNAGIDIGQIGNLSAFLGTSYDSTFGVISANALKLYSSNALAVTIDTSQNVSFASATDATSTTAASVVLSGGLGVAKSIVAGGNASTGGYVSTAGGVLSGGQISVTSVVDSTSTSSGSITTFGGVGITKSLVVGGTISGASYKGITSGSSIAAGMIGEDIDAGTALVTATASATAKNILSLTLTPGKWVITATAFGAWSVSSPSTSAPAEAEISTANNTVSGTVSNFHGYTTPSSTLSLSGFMTLNRVVNISSNTTYYLNMVSTYSSTNPSYYGSMRAVRIG